MSDKLEKKIRVVAVISNKQVALNVGANDDIHEQDEFIVYGLSGEDILDPETRENLGKLEIFRGIGVVSYVQDKMCILNAISKNPFQKLSSSFGYYSEGVFIDPQVSDFAKPNATKRKSSWL